MRTASMVLAGVAVAGSGCGPSTRTPEPPQPTGAWTWTASSGGPWRLPERAYVIAIAPDDAHAVVAFGGRRVVVVDLATGAIGPVTEVVTEEGAKIDELVRSGDRLLGFGVDARGSAAWTIELAASGPVATPIALPDRAPEAMGSKSYNAAVLSPDGSRIIVCTSKRKAVVRDARTLATITVVDAGVPCRDPVWADNTHVQYRGSEPHAIDLTTNVATALTSRGNLTYGGPGGWSLTVSDYSKWKFSDGAGRVTELRSAGIPRWLPTGAAVLASGLGTLSVQSATGGEARKIALPVEELPVRMAVTGDAATAVVLVDHTLLAVDLGSGAVRTVDGNVGAPLQIAPRNGAVIVTSDRIRAWRDGKLEANGEAGVVGFTAEPLNEPVATISGTTVSVWEPATGDRKVIHELAELGYFVGRAGDRLVFDDGGSLWRSRRGGAAARWFRFRDDLILAGLDAAAGRVAWYLDDLFLIADINRGDVYAFCSPGMQVRWDASAPRIAVEDGIGVQIYDLSARAPIHRLELDGLELVSAFVGSTGDVAIATPETLGLWTPGADTALIYPTGTSRTPVALGVDARGAELAVAYADGTILWASFAGLRAHASPTPVTLVPPDSPDCPLPARATLDDITVIPEEDPFPDPTDAECDDDNDNPDDDCSLIYGTPD